MFKCECSTRISFFLHTCTVTVRLPGYERAAVLLATKQKCLMSCLHIWKPYESQDVGVIFLPFCYNKAIYYWQFLPALMAIKLGIFNDTFKQVSGNKTYKIFFDEIWEHFHTCQCQATNNRCISTVPSEDKILFQTCSNKSRYLWLYGWRFPAVLGTSRQYFRLCLCWHNRVIRSRMYS